MFSESVTTDYLAYSTVGRGKHKTIVLKVPGPEESQEEQDSGSEASDSVSNSGQSSTQNTNNVTLITLNSEGERLHLDDSEKMLRIRLASLPELVHVFL